MKAITKDNAAPRTTRSEEQAASKVSHEEIKPAAPFQHKKAGDQPCMSFLPALQDKVRGIADQKQSERVPAVHQMSEEDRDFFNAGKAEARRIAKDWLNFLVRYDEGIHHDDVHILCNAINAIDRAVPV